MAENENNAPPIIIKKIKKGGHGHHGGAWKVAYADFVTAMMAFFLLLWLLQATTEEQKLGIADYFAPASVARSSSGSGGAMGGRTYTKQGAHPNDQAPVGVVVELPTKPPDWDATSDGEADTSVEDATADHTVKAVDDEDVEDFLAQREDEQFAAAEDALRQAIDNVPDLRTLANNLLIDQTEEGLRIHIIDEAGKSMFPSGSAEMFEHTKKLLKLVVDAVKQLPQKVAIKGHTDSAPFTTNQGYSNWELSTDRANSSRRALVDAGLPSGRIASVVGLADKQHLDQDDPVSPRNRRISIILLREAALATHAPWQKVE